MNGKRARKGRRLAGRRPLRSFALGSLVGAAGAIVTARLRRASRHTAGLAAFEDAPCFRELVERDVYPDGGTTETGASKPE